MRLGEGRVKLRIGVHLGGVPPLGEQLRNRIEQARAGLAWKVYEDARAQVQAWMDAGMANGGTVSDYWAEELAGFEYMLDASPLVKVLRSSRC